jgi:hypothetical protein
MGPQPQTSCVYFAGLAHLFFSTLKIQVCCVCALAFALLHGRLLSCCVFIFHLCQRTTCTFNKEPRYGGGGGGVVEQQEK